MRSHEMVVTLPSKSMKLLVITQKVDNSDDIMGFFHNWLSKLASLVDEIHVLALERGAVDLPDNVHVYSLGKEHGDPKWRWGLRFYRHLIRLLPGTDGVFCHMSPEYVLAVHPVNVFFRKRVILWYAHVRVSGTAAWAGKKVYRVFSPSRDSFGTGTKNLVESGHGIDTETFRPSDSKPGSERFELLSVSRISKVKEFNVLVDAVAVLVNELGFHRFRVTVVGAPARPEDDEYLESLKKSSRQAGVDEYIRWVGSIPHRDVVPYIQRSHALVRMLGDGGFGKHELEALSCGVPALVCTPVYRDVYGEFAASLCWQEKDASDLADKIRATASWSENDRERFSSLARSYVESHHNLNNLVRKIVDEFQSGALS